MFLPRSVATKGKQLQPPPPAKRKPPSEKKVLVEDFRSEPSPQARVTDAPSSSAAENADRSNIGEALRHDLCC